MRTSAYGEAYLVTGTDDVDQTQVNDVDAQFGDRTSRTFSAQVPCSMTSVPSIWPGGLGPIRRLVRRAGTPGAARRAQSEPSGCHSDSFYCSSGSPAAEYRRTWPCVAQGVPAQQRAHSHELKAWTGGRIAQHVGIVVDAGYANAS